MTSCSVCLGEVSDESVYHPECLEFLFGTRTLPNLNIELSQLYSLAATRMAGKMSISGAQEKVSLTLSPDKSNLEVSATGGRYILKPETSRFSFLPENEQLTMRLARLVSLEVPPFGIMRLKNFSLITTPEGMRQLSPAYDLLCTKLVIPDDTLAMPIGGRRSKLRRDRWLHFAEYCGIPERSANRMISELIDYLEPAVRLVGSSFLPGGMKQEYEDFLRRNTSALTG